MNSNTLVECRKGCGIGVPRHNLSKHEEIECTLICKERRQRLMQMLTDETGREKNEMLLKIKEKEKEIESVKEDYNARLRMLHWSTTSEGKDIVLYNYDENAHKEKQLKADVVPVIRKVISFSYMKDKKKAFMSKPFYTHINGYKMCFFVHPNGYGRAEGTHVSVMISIMRGDNDYYLQWPFRGVVTFRLLDQSQNKDHKEVTVSYVNSTLSYSGRVLIGNYSPAKGKLWMVSHKSLTGSSGSQYVKNDCMILEVCKVEINRSRAVRKTEQRKNIFTFLIFIVISLLVHLCVIYFSSHYKLLFL